MNYVEKYHETLKARDEAMSRGDLFMMHAKEIQLRFLRKKIGSCGKAWPNGLGDNGDGKGTLEWNAWFGDYVGSHEVECTANSVFQNATYDADAFA